VKSILFIFLDGVGIGDPTSSNPFNNLQLSGFNWLSGGQDWVNSSYHDISTTSHVFRGIDATLGVEGLPQSGTGQATLFSGVNCSKLAGKHYGPFPHSTSRPVLAASNMFIQVGGSERADGPAFLNAYPERFFEAAKKRDRWSVTTRCCLDAGIKIRTIEDLNAGLAVAADIQGLGLGKVAKTPVIAVSAAEAARRMVYLSGQHNLLLFEYFLTDKAGHAQDADMAKSYLESIDNLLLELSKQLDPEQTTLILTSDHGNIEDLSVRTHTFNPVPFAAKGALAHHFKGVRDLTGVTPGIVSALAP